MLTIGECRDLFVVQYKLECRKHKFPEMDIPNKTLASWIASAQQDVSLRLKILNTYVDLAYTPVTVFTKYDLPSNFGAIIKTEPELRIVDISDLSSYAQSGNSLEQGEPQSIAVYYDTTGFHAALYPLPESANTIRIWYSVDTGMYSPSAAAAQDWGTFDGSTFTGNLKVPDRYIDLVITHMLGKVFDEKKMEYETMLSRARNNAGSTRKDGLDYQPIGGYSIE